MAEDPQPSRMQQLVQQYGLVAALIYLTTSLIVGVPIAYGLSKGVDASGWSFLPSRAALFSRLSAIIFCAFCEKGEMSY